MPDKSHPLSTSALAKALDKTTKQMFTELESLGWIKRVDDSWLLTSKGEFEGGTYRESTKFGRYIIWPSETVKHRALVSVDSHLLSFDYLATQLSLSDRIIGLLLQELGWIKAGRKGWLLTALGEAAGGFQRENRSTGIPYIMWREDVLDNSILTARVTSFQQGSEGKNDYLCCDGHNVTCEAERKIDNWLYLSGLLHAYRTGLPCEGDLDADFYLPQHQLYIEYWGKETPKSMLSAKIEKKEKFIKMGVDLIELNDEEVANLDEALPRMLLKYNIEV